MKFKVLVVSLVLSISLLAGCSAQEDPTAGDDPNADVTTTASIVADENAFLDAISNEGTWIIATLNDITTDKELVVEGEFYDKDDTSKDLYRKIAPYTQDADHNVTERFTITAPKMTIKSPNTKIQGGTFVGDVYVEANGFTVKDATIEGNVYFANEEYKASFATEKEGKVTGVTEVEEGTDVVTTASVVTDEASLVNAMSKEGAWIIIFTEDMTTDEELVLEGEFHNKDDATKDLYRKIAPYTQDADHNITESFTITAPKMTIKSPNTRFQGGTFVGDVYVEANGFNLSKATIDGNVYFANEEYKESFSISEGEVTGVTEVK